MPTESGSSSQHFPEGAGLLLREFLGHVGEAFLRDEIGVAGRESGQRLGSCSGSCEPTPSGVLEYRAFASLVLNAKRTRAPGIRQWGAGSPFSSGSVLAELEPHLDHPAATPHGSKLELTE